MKKVIGLFFNNILHLVCLAVIILALYPFASWYLSDKYLYGIDFYNTVSLLATLKRTIGMPPLVWFPYWFGGWPYLSQYPVLHFYLMLPLTNFFSIIKSVEIYALITIAFFYLGLYFLSFTLFRNRLVAVLLTVCGIYSIGYYGALLWGGSLPFFFTQSFYPWILLCIFLFLKNNNFKMFILATLLTGLSIWGHPQIPLTYFFPAVTIIILFSWTKAFRFLSFRKIKLLFLYGFISVLIGLPQVYLIFVPGIKGILQKGHTEQASSTVFVPSEEQAALDQFHKAQPFRIYSDNYQGLFILAGLSIAIGLIPLLLNIKKSKNHFVLGGILLVVYSTLYVFIYAYGISIYHGGWYRLFWAVPVWASVLGGVFWLEFDTYLNKIIRQKIITTILVWVVSIVVVVVSFTLSKQVTIRQSTGSANPYQEIWNKMNPLADQLSAKINTILYPFNPAGFITRVTNEGKATFASGHPTNLIVKGDEELKVKKLIPTFIDPNNLNSRLYSADQTFNIWWNTFNNMPLARGYLDPPIENRERGYLFWLDAALNVDPKDSAKPLLPSGFNYPEAVAIQNARFLIDWNAIGYLQGGGSSPYPGTINNLIDNNDFIAQKEKVAAESVLGNNNLFLQYYKIKNELTSPIISATNAPVVGIFASESGYETIIRTLAALDLNSKWIIPVKLNKYLDRYSLSELSQFDIIFLYDYDYSNYGKAFNNLIKYVEKGGQLFIDSGVETKESDGGSNLAEIFPFTKIHRLGIGKNWDLKINDSQLTKDVSAAQFSETLFDKDEWKFALPDGDTRDGVNVLATNHGYPVLTLAKFSQGKVIWSGMNLSYHITRYHNITEANFFKNILLQLLPLENKPPLELQFDWQNSRKIIIKEALGKGVLVKEQNFPGWQAYLQGFGGLTIWPAGPANPGYMYVRLPAEVKSKNLILSYNGSRVIWFLWIIALLTVLVMLDYMIMGGIIVSFISRLYIRSIGKFLKKWWEKDDEDV